MTKAGVVVGLLIAVSGLLSLHTAQAAWAQTKSEGQQRHVIHALVDIGHEFTFYFDGRFGRAYLAPVGGKDARHWATLSVADLSRCNLLVIHHGTSPCPYTEADVALVTRFVREGGGLLMVGDYRASAREFKLNTLASAFGLEFVNEKPKGQLRIVRHPVTESVAEVQGQANGIVRYKDGWTPLVTDEAGAAVVAVREFGKGRVAAVHGSGLVGDKPKDGDARNAAWVQRLCLWLSANRTVNPNEPPVSKMPEKEKVVRGLRVQYSSYLEPYADAITELYFKVAEQLREVTGVPLSEGKNLNLILIATGGGGFSSGVALGIGAFWGGFPEQQYPMIELIGHETTHSWVLPFGEPMWNEGVATYLGMEVGRRLGFKTEADKTRRDWAQSCEKIDPDYTKIDISQPEQPGLHNVYMAKPMWIFDRLREKYGDDIIARYFQAKRRLIKEGERKSYAADDCVAVLSIAAGEDLFGWFNSLGIKVARERTTVR